MSDIDYDALLAESGRLMLNRIADDTVALHVQSQCDAIRALRAALAESERDAGRIKLLEQIIDEADSIISICGGDAWERECTEESRDLYARLHDQAFPQQPEQRTREAVEFSSPQKTLRCGLCEQNTKKYSDVGLIDHMRAKHAHAAMAAQDKAK